MRSRSWAPVVCTVLVGLFLADLTLRPGGVHLTRTIDDVAEMVAAFAAAAAGAWRVGQSASARLRISWSFIAAGCAAWGIGEAIWCYYELIAGRDTPFPSWADAGFLVFPVLALVGLLVRPSAAFTGQGRTRVTLDAALVAASLFVISWITALGQVYHAGADTTFANVVSLAYPVSDLVLLTVTVIVVTYARTGDRHGLAWIAGGLVALSFGDSGFAYLTTVGSYGAVNLVDSGWVAGFLIIAVAAVMDRSEGNIARVPVTPLAALVLPYLPATAAIVAILLDISDGNLDGVATVGAAVLVTSLIARQLLVVLENRTLMIRVTHQAFHDELTGLANRALFNDRLAHALDLHRRDLRPVTVLLMDIDDFKTVNDTLGHPAGDELLMRISERLLGAIRTGDTVARLGGDEFALLLEDGGDAIDVAERMLNALDVPVSVSGHDLQVRASVGIATLAASDTPSTGTEMLKRADLAMYSAKHAGKGTIRHYSPDLADSQTMPAPARAD
jgi:diguanylate cyclase